MAKKVPKAYLTGHKTKRVVIKQSDIDINIIPVVKWLNSFESVHTLFSCEGETKQELKDGGERNKPYVLFTCWDQLELMTILRELDVATCEVTYYEAYGLRYRLKFIDKEAMLNFCESDEVKKFA